MPPTRWGLLINWQPPLFSPCINLMDTARRARNELFNKLNKVQSNRKSANKLQPLTAVIWLIGQLYKGQYRITVQSCVIKSITANNYITYGHSETNFALLSKIFMIFEISAQFYTVHYSFSIVPHIKILSLLNSDSSVGRPETGNATLEPLRSFPGRVG